MALIAIWIFAGPNEANQIGGIIATIVAIFSALLWALNNSLSFRAGNPGPAQLDLAARELREALTVQWGEEAKLRGLRQVAPATVRWTTFPSLTRIESVPEGPWNSDYEREIHGLHTSAPGHRLVVVGPPASGKSVFALLLTLALLGRQSSTQPVPVMLSLSSWNPQTEEFESWVERRLSDTYPFLNNSTVYGLNPARQLWKTQRITLILDGLDEIAEAGRAMAVHKLRQAFPPDTAFVITCRSREYDELRDSGLRFAKSTEVVLRPLATDDVIAYLYEATDPPGHHTSANQPSSRTWVRKLLTGKKNREPRRDRLTKALKSDEWGPVFQALSGPGNTPLKQIMSVPLYASLVRIKYGAGDAPPATLLEDVRDRDTGHIKVFLIEDLIARFGGPGQLADGAGHGPDTGRRLLEFLAIHLTRLRRPAFEWWRVHEFLSPRTWAVLAGLCTGLIYPLTIELPEGLKRGTAVGVTFGIMIGLTRGTLSGRRLGLVSGSVAVVSVFAGGAGIVGPYEAGFVAAELGAALGVVISFMAAMQHSARRLWQAALLAGAGAAVATGIHDALEGGATAGLVRASTTTIGIAIGVAVPALICRWQHVGRPPPQPALLNVSRARRERRLLPYLVVGAASGLVVGMGPALIGALRYWFSQGIERAINYGSVVGLSYGLTLGLAVGLTGGYVRWISQPPADSIAATPQSTLRASRAVAITYLLVPPLGAAGMMLALRHLMVEVFRLGDSMSDLSANLSPFNGAAVGLCIGAALACCFSQWPSLQLVRISLWLSRNSPLRLMRCLERARRHEILRQDGAVYQFRHEEIQQTLVKPQDSDAPPAR
ncbi:NACHT domain-containing protein [Sphaerisporangium aureirubrum]|uniref:NACHT domain-containing protein n=1 Tax=Sphaerisporangium aureirubrum TaxID=1544736 RepID=A0ABW1NUI8_9ACTN